MPLRRLLIFILVLLLLALFLWAAVHITRQIEISNFTTSLEGRNDAQIENLQLACARIDGVVLKPGDIFSFNEVVGERLRRFGYKGAPTIYQGKVVETPGGGICQLSSTLYNAALLAGMEILERTPHLWTIDSVGPGRDAAILYDKIDLKFKNRRDYPVRITAEARQSRIIVRFLAPQKPPQEISIEVETLRTIPAPIYPHYPQTNPSTTPFPVKGRDGCKVKAYRIFKENGKVVRRENLSTDTYQPVPGGSI